MSRAMVWIASMLFLAQGCARPDESKDSRAEPVSAVAQDVADTGIVQDRADWESFWQGLPRDSALAAAALERYRQAAGLPFMFFVRPSAPVAIRSALRKEEEMACGEVTRAFVRRLPVGHAVFETLRAIEFDTAGGIVREWPLPGDAGFFELVRGVDGDELVARYPGTELSIFLRIRPDGTFLVSSVPAAPLPREEWIEVADSTFVRVRPRDDGTFTVYGGSDREEVGTWVPSGDSGWYIRTDSVPGRRSAARAVTRPWGPSPRLVSCPEGMTYEGMVCRGFPGAEREYRIAYPMPCT